MKILEYFRSFLQVYLADFSVLASANDDTGAAAGGDVGAGEEQVDLVLVDGAEVIDGLGLLWHGDGLTSQEGLVNAD